MAPPFPGLPAAGTPCFCALVVFFLQVFLFIDNISMWMACRVFGREVLCDDSAFSNDKFVPFINSGAPLYGVESHEPTLRPNLVITILNTVGRGDV